MHAAMKADMDPKTARRYLRAGRGPKELKAKHDWRTRADPLATIWPQAEQMLQDAPELEAKFLFEHLLTTNAVPVAGRALRTFQRRVEQWRRRHGPPREVCFPQVHEPARWLQFDWTHASELQITIAGQAYSTSGRQRLIFPVWSSSWRKRGGQRPRLMTVLILRELQSQ